MTFQQILRHMWRGRTLFSFLIIFVLLCGRILPAYASESQTENDSEFLTESDSFVEESEYGTDSNTTPDLPSESISDNTIDEVDEDTDSNSEEEEEELEEFYYPEYVAELTIEEGQIRIYAPEGTFPEGTVVEIRRIYEDSEDYERAQGALRDHDVAYDGFFGLDISFYFRDEKIEPIGNMVDVSFTLDQTQFHVTEGDLDPNSLTVHHLLEDEVGNIIGVEAVADTAEETTGSVQAEDNMVEAVFSVSSFSYITVTYNNQYPRRINLLDENGQHINGTGELSLKTNTNDDVNDFYDKWLRSGQWVSIETFLSQYGSFTEGYTFQEARIGNRTVKWIRQYNNTWIYHTQDTQPTTVSGAYWNSGVQINAYYTKDPTNEQTGDLQISDHIPTDGTIRATYTPSSGSGEGITFKWSRSINGTDWTEVDRVKVTGARYNLSEDGADLNVALDRTVDEGLETLTVNDRLYYKVEAYDASGNLVSTSSAFQVPYFSALQNGDFEDVNVLDISQGGNNYQFPNGTTGIGWTTTGDDNQIEIANDYYSQSHNSKAQSGNQFAELNAEAKGALYQEVLTIPGSTLYWELYHKARNTTGSDTMYLVIAPSSEVSDITHESELDDLITKILADPDGYAAKGYYIRTMTDTNASWGHYTDAYEATSYLTRFFFVAGSTATGNPTFGNLLDNVSFTTEVPEPEAGYGNLTVTKTVSGLLDEDMENYTLPITVTRDDGQTLSHNLTGFTSHDGGRTYTSSFTFTNLPVSHRDWVRQPGGSWQYVTTNYAYTAEEDISNVSEDNYTMTSTVNGTTGTRSNSMNIPDGGHSDVSFTNTYIPKTTDLKITKKVTGNMGNKQKEFTFRFTDKDGNATDFTLKDGETKLLTDVIIGSTVSLVESDNEGYDVTVSYGTSSGGSFTGNSVTGISSGGTLRYAMKVEEGKDEVLVVNHKEATPDTGVSTDSHPYRLLLVLIAVFVPLMICFRRTRRTPW